MKGSIGLNFAIIFIVQRASGVSRLQQQYGIVPLIIIAVFSLIFTSVCRNDETAV